MDVRKNPYAPGAGTPPPLLVGRDALLTSADVAFSRAKSRLAAKSFVAVGLRGVGKTVVLAKVQDIADQHGYQTAYIEASEDISIIAQLIPKLRTIILKLNRLEGAKEKARSALRTMRSFASVFKVTYGDFDVGINLDPEPGLADSGNLEADLPDLLISVGEAAAERNTAVALIIDEIQYLREHELSALITAIHRVNQKSLPVVLVAAGLPQVLAKMGNAKSYAERLFDFPPVSALPLEDAIRAIVSPAQDFGADFTVAAVDEIMNATQRYPYFLQEWAYVSWNVAEGPVISLDDVLKSHHEATRRLDQSFFKMRLERMTKLEKNYMRAMAELGPGPHRSGEIASTYDARVTTLAPTRSSLIAKGMIYSPSYGDTEFTVPMFDDFMRREMPLKARR